jgi:hypothetical protein
MGSRSRCLQGANILTQANLTIGGERPIQRSKHYGGPEWLAATTIYGRHQEAFESIWTARPYRS